MSTAPSLRRRWLLGAAAFAAVSFRNLGLEAAVGCKSHFECTRKKLLSLLDEPQRVGRVGRAYLESPIAHVAPPAALVETVLAEMGPDAGIEPIRVYIVECIRRELQNVEVISLDGWIMAPTEAQLCGLAALDIMA
jgi:hypothetical protein